jgi:hypothetical protein
MKAGSVFTGTMQFCWLKLLVGVLHIIVAGILAAIALGLWMILPKSGVVALVLIVGWCSLLGIINLIFKHYLGYLLKAGHVAVIARSFLDDKIPDAPFRTGAKMVKDRFVTTNVYFVIDKLVAGAVKQLQRKFGNLTGMLGGIPGVDALTKLGKFFIDISLGYVDECCLGYTFYNDKQNAFKSAADGVVVYAQNWKTILKNAAITMFVVLLVFALITVIAAVIYGGIFHLFVHNPKLNETGGIVCVVLALLTAYTIKYAFIDTWILVKMMSSYMEVAPKTQISFDLYGKLKALSSSFTELLKKADSAPAPSQSSYVPATPSEPVAAPEPTQVDAPLPAATVCPACGATFTPGTKFCGSCGYKLP